MYARQRWEDLDAGLGLRDSEEGLAKNSGRQAGRSHLAIKFRGDEFGPKDMGLALARRWFDIQVLSRNS